MLSSGSNCTKWIAVLIFGLGPDELCSVSIFFAEVALDGGNIDLMLNLIKA